jgi:phosphoenolpyruvate carboxylase
MEKEQMLREDRRLLGDVIEDQVGAGTRERIEAIRQAAVSFRKAEGEKAKLEALLDPLPIDETLHVVRAFSYFSHLLNIAEDVQQNRRRHAHASGPARPGSIGYALDHAGKDGLLEWFGRARISPVLTAHPDRGAAPEHPRVRARDCAAGGGAAVGGARQGAARGGAAAVAHRDAAPLEARGGG